MKELKVKFTSKKAKEFYYSTNNKGEKVLDLKYATPGSAGLDLKAVTKEWDSLIDCYIYGTGIAVEIPKGYVGLLFPRSSVRKYTLSQANCVGVIDSDYRGEIMVTFRLTSIFNQKVYKEGDKCCQLVIVPVEQYNPIIVDDLENTVRGTKGHGEADNGK